MNFEYSAFSTVQLDELFNNAFGVEAFPSAVNLWVNIESNITSCSSRISTVVKRISTLNSPVLCRVFLFRLKIPQRTSRFRRTSQNPLYARYYGQTALWKECIQAVNLLRVLAQKPTTANVGLVGVSSVELVEFFVVFSSCSHLDRELW